VTKNVKFATFTQIVMIRTYCSTPEVHQTSIKAGPGINILYLLLYIAVGNQRAMMVDK